MYYLHSFITQHCMKEFEIKLGTLMGKCYHQAHVLPSVHFACLAFCMSSSMFPEQVSKVIGLRLHGLS